MTRWQMIARQIRHRKEAIAPFGHDATRAALDPQRLTWSILHRKVPRRSDESRMTQPAACSLQLHVGS